MGAIEGDASGQIAQSWSNSSIRKILDVTGLVPHCLILRPDQKAIEVYLSPTECITFIRGQKFRIQELWSEQPLDRGISGAWVVVGTNVCRLIFPVFDVQPRAIIHPISHVLQAISILGQQLSLPDGILQDITGRLNNQDPFIRSIAISILGQRPNLTDGVLRDIMNYSRNEDASVRRAATDALGNFLAPREYEIAEPR
ncbi:hypothetical protein FOXG_17291 [Fusarium oxysporum f. sp. lycopersici 4287]|uniref:HEAT repeat domain-containing protein n=2 Tax=Fusarium oxysporum TaxID=5507 RepID=A0A0J9WVS7_FUSO4|nr:uncharacterized protein FOXG_17291 [Fusarium oxysporum f. sp. lycopersici 4287]KNB20052.1 hypothetical protein FOXG_17291 [Fusarium oxysporum f. sp. lycopersici 4287]